MCGHNYGPDSARCPTRNSEKNKGKFPCGVLISIDETRWIIDSLCGCSITGTYRRRYTMGSEVLLGVRYTGIKVVRV